jgi:hypothetical protein
MRRADFVWCGGCAALQLQKPSAAERSARVAVHKGDPNPKKHAHETAQFTCFCFKSRFRLAVV